MEPVLADTAAIALVGAELLSGKVADQNLVELARTLRALGVRLSRAVMLPDALDVLTLEIRALKSSHDLVFTSGGVGPTHDDLTVDGFLLDTVPLAVVPVISWRRAGRRRYPASARDTSTRCC